MNELMSVLLHVPTEEWLSKTFHSIGMEYFSTARQYR